MEMAAKANTSNNSIIISSDSDTASDSDSTDYEPEPKKCKRDDRSDEDNSYLESNTLVTIPIRAATSVRTYDNSGNVVDHEIENGTEARSNTRGSYSSRDVRPDPGDGRSFLSVGSLVQQTIQATFDRDPYPTSHSQFQVSQELFPDGIDTDERGAPQVANASTSTSSPPPPTHGGDFPTIAREVVIRTVGRTPQASAEGNSQRGNRRRRSRRWQNIRVPSNNSNPAAPADNDNSVSQSGSGSSSSRSSSEYFTDDIDPQDIPSDEYLSPPIPTRQRRNAIFVRRDPPPSVQNEDDQYYHNELEVASVLDMNENPIEDDSSTSEVDDEALRRSLSPYPDPATPQPLRGETDTNFADNENAKSDGESELMQPSTSNASENNASDSDNLADKDKTLCIQCHAQRAEPYFRYCLRCFKIRRQWLPQRPASRRLKNRKALMRSTNNNNSNSLNNSRTTRSTDTSEGEDVVDGGPSGSQPAPPDGDDTAENSSQSLVQRSLPSSPQLDMNAGFILDDNNPTGMIQPDTSPGNITLTELFAPPPRPEQRPEATSTSADTDSQSQSQSQSGSSSSQSQRSLSSLNSQNSCGTVASTQSSSPSSQPLQSSSPLPNRMPNNDIVATTSSLCSICFVREKDAAFVHNKIAHLYCCYTCADKILKKNGRCPICRERVLRVVRIISV